MIVGITGYINSGKSTLGKALEKRGFTRISFADYLKWSVAELYKFDIKFCYSQQAKEEVLATPYIWDEKACKALAKITKEKLVFSGKVIIFDTIRYALQYIGTEVYREYDEDFHVKKTVAKLEKDKNYYSDDMRFQNEVNAIKVNGGHTVKVCRDSVIPVGFAHASENISMLEGIDTFLFNDRGMEEFEENINTYTDWLDNPDKIVYDNSII